MPRDDLFEFISQQFRPQLPSPMPHWHWRRPRVERRNRVTIPGSPLSFGPDRAGYLVSPSCERDHCSSRRPSLRCNHQDNLFRCWQESAGMVYPLVPIASDLGQRERGADTSMVQRYPVFIEATISVATERRP
jgi:hypothetical protein